jgi:hypothetical protein
MPLQTPEYWRQKAALAREAAETMNGQSARTATLEIAQLYERLAVQTEKLAKSGVRKPPDAT